MTHAGTKRWIDFYKQAVDNYNRSYSRAIGGAPADVTLENQNELARKLYGHLYERKQHKSTYNVGDFVRLRTPRSILTKGYVQSYLDKPKFVIRHVRRNAGSPSVYRVSVLDGDEQQPVPGIFYDQVWHIGIFVRYIC